MGRSRLPRSRSGFFVVVVAVVACCVVACVPPPSSPTGTNGQPITNPGDPITPPGGFDPNNTIVPTPVSTTVPAPPSVPLGNVRTLAAGYDHTCAVVDPPGDRFDESVVCWGRNASGQLGNGSTALRSNSPVTVAGLSNIFVEDLAAGGDHTCAVVKPQRIPTNQLFCWGSNSRGQLGLRLPGSPGGIASSSTPVLIPGLEFPIGVTAGRDHTCVVEEPSGRGRLKCWGNGDSGQTGIPLRRPAGVLSGVEGRFVVAGADHTCALTLPRSGLSLSPAKCWGSNLESQLGSGPPSNGGPRARNVFAPRDFVRLSSKVNHTCGVRRFFTEQEILCWGSNFAGQLGFAGPNPPIPVRVDPTGIVPAADGSSWDIAAGGGHSCVTDTYRPGPVACWGLNATGQLGNGSRTSSTRPVQVSGITNATQVETGLNHTCALLVSRSVQCWGQGGRGQLGAGSAQDSTVPVTVTAPLPPPPPPPAAERISSGSQHTCAIVDGGRVRCWGFNSSGQLGTGDRSERQAASPVPDLAGAIQISAGGTHTCATLGDGTLRCWGSNNRGKLGTGDRERRLRPTPVTGLSDVIQVSAGRDHTCALRRAGRVSCWGSNFAGALGNGSDVDSTTPVDVVNSDGTPLTEVVQVAAGLDFTCVVRLDSAVSCWGSNKGIANGDDPDNAPFPQPALDETGEPGTQLRGAVRIDAGSLHACAMMTDGSARCWGDGGDGELGDGRDRGSSFPVRVSDIEDAIWITAGDDHSCAILRNGSGRCWGSNFYGTLGNGLRGDEAPDALSPIAVASLGSATQISAGANHTCALVTGGGRCWGLENFGELGNGPRTGSSPIPVAVIGL